MKLRLTAVLILLTPSIWGADAFPTDRRGTLPDNRWEFSGVRGGIPSVTTISDTLAAGSSLATVQAAVDACASNEVVQLDPGLFNFANGILFIDRQGVVVRGTTNSAGVPLTLLSNAVVSFYDGYTPGNGDYSRGTTRTIASGISPGSTRVVFDSTPDANFALGSIMMIFQTNDLVNVIPDTEEGDFLIRPNRSYSASVQITNISGTTVDFTPPLLGEFWDNDLAPDAYGVVNLDGASARMSGIEDVAIDGNSVGGSDGYWKVKLFHAVDCWAKNIQVIVDPAAGLNVHASAFCSVVDSVFRDTTDSGSGTYGIQVTMASATRLENNIFTNLSLAITLQSANGCAVAYNYGVGPYPYPPSTWFAEYFFPHGGHNTHLLFEGNYIEAPIFIDSIFHNSDSYIAMVRNRIVGYATGKTSDTSPIHLETNKFYVTALGNVLGHDTHHTTYFSFDPEASGAIYGVEVSSTNTFLRLGNYNTVDDGVPAQESIGVDTIDNSYIYSSKPSSFGILPWPPYDPGDYSGSYATNIPAGHRSIIGIWPPAEAGGEPDPDPTTKRKGPGRTIKLLGPSFTGMINTNELFLQQDLFTLFISNSSAGWVPIITSFDYGHPDFDWDLEFTIWPRFIGEDEPMHYGVTYIDYEK